MGSPQQVLVLATEGQWLEEPAVAPPAAFPWRETWNSLAVPSAGPDLVVAPEQISLAVLRSWRRAAPATDLLIATRAGDERLEALFGDQGVFFLQPASELAELRAGIDEVLSYRRSCGALADEGKDPPRVEEERPVIGWLELTGPSHPVFLRRFRGWMEILGTLGLGAEEYRRLLHAVREIGWNAIEWGNRFSPERRLSLSYLLLEDRILFRVESEGQSEDWYEPRSDAGDAAEIQRRRAARGVRPGGLGLVLVRSVVDRMDVSSHGRIVIFEKRLLPPGERAISLAAKRMQGEHA